MRYGSYPVPLLEPAQRTPAVLHCLARLGLSLLNDGMSISALERKRTDSASQTSLAAATAAVSTQHARLLPHDLELP